MTNPSTNYINSIIAGQKRGEAVGITSICSAHPYVLRAAMEEAKEHGFVLIESTCNQVNQFGGYTGMNPAGFAHYVRVAAGACGFKPERILLGGDHLGPSVWQSEPETSAMEKARVLVHDYIRAGYTKIHLDASMKLAGDPPGPLAPETAARRAAELAAVSERAVAEGMPAPHYVIGTEVPVPGGAHEHEDNVQVTTPASAQETIEVVRAAFMKLGLQAAWERVIALVVQPGVEFGDDFVLDYDPAAARPLKEYIETVPGLVYEAHSTDYQTPAALRSLVRYHFAILKVGPGLTFAFREGVFALAAIEEELLAGDPGAIPSRVTAELDAAMLDNPVYWQKYYPGSEARQRYARKYSLSDRSRYYWTAARVQGALQKLLDNLHGQPIPLPLLSQWAPEQYQAVRSGSLPNHPEQILLDHIKQVLRDYQGATAQAAAQAV